MNFIILDTCEYLSSIQNEQMRKPTLIELAWIVWVIILVILLIRSGSENARQHKAIENLQQQTLTGQLNQIKSEWADADVREHNASLAREQLAKNCENQDAILSTQQNNASLDKQDLQEKADIIRWLMWQGTTGNSDNTWAAAVVLKVIN